MQRPRYDDWWRSVTPALEQIEVPALICASFSDHNLHSRGSFRAFQLIGSALKRLYTHRGGKVGLLLLRRGPGLSVALDHFLKGEANGMSDVPPVRCEAQGYQKSTRSG